MKFLTLAVAFVVAGCAPVVVGAAAGGAGGYLVGTEYEIHHRPHCWNEVVGRDYWGHPVVQHYCR